MNRYLKVEGHPNLIRDTKTNAIINTDTQSSNNYTLNKKRREVDREKIDSLSKDIELLKSSMEEIKQLLKVLTNGS